MYNQNILTASENIKSEYCCNIIRIGELHPIEGSDFLAQTYINGESVVVRKDQIKEGDIMFYAMNECALCNAFLSANSLYRDNNAVANANFAEVKPLFDEADNKFKYTKEIVNRIKSLERALRHLNNKQNPELGAEKAEKVISTYVPVILEKYKNAENKIDVLHNTIKYLRDEEKAQDIKYKEIKQQISRKCGFFEKTGRVKAIKLKGIPSFGYIFSKDELAKWHPEVNELNLEELIGLDFDTVCGELMAKAYVPKLSMPSQKSRKSAKEPKLLERMCDNEFLFHYDTDPLGKNIWKISPNDIVAISTKIHGCVERNTIVTTKEYGNITIGEIVDKKINCHIKAYDTAINQIVYVPIDNFYYMPNDGDWFEIELENGKTITITGNNPVWLPDKEVYRRVDELIGDEYLLID